MLHDDGSPRAEVPDLQIVAFTHFRFEYDQDEELVYWCVAALHSGVFSLKEILQL